ncbi:fatty-acid amide hydrolase 2-A-like [Atheta coriaria]|uniref:fatty-acid amide hydrolase 2-A-like n=1 Tax=Dalotia coriaria TaxID=877792 RepID=UPI0031F3BEC8
MGVIDYIRLFFDLVVEFVFGLFYSKEVVPSVKDDLLLMSATQLAKGIRTKKFTSQHVVRAYLARIEEVNRTLNAVVDIRAKDAIADAISIDERIPHMSPAEFKSLPFLGVPFTAKESTLCENMSATFGLKQRLNVRSDQDAVVIQNMKRAGGILIAVTNVPQLNLWVETHNPVYGLTRNPYNTSCAVGGSSGGEASILAACGSPIGIGTDIGGSIRIPAYMCGIFGHKCSNGLTDTKGLTFRDGSETEHTMVAIGPMCRKSEDLIPGIIALLGKKADLLNLSVPVDTRKLKFYYIEKNSDIRCSPIRADVEYINKMVVNHFLKDRTVERLEVPKLKYSSALYKYWMEQECGGFRSDVTNRTYEASAGSELWKYLTGRSEYSFSVVLVLMSLQWMPSPNEEWARETTQEIRNYLMDKLGDDGVLLYPSWPQTATYHHVGYFRPFNYSYTSIFNLLKFPVTQVPLGLNKDGLPVGIQVAAAPMNDRLCVAVAKELEQVFGGYAVPQSANVKK